MGGRVIHVDDNKADRELVWIALHEIDSDIEYYGCATGTECLSTLCRHSANHRFPLVLIIDINMPDMDGFEVTRRIRDYPEWNHIPIMMLSTSLSTRDRDKAHAMGAQRYEVKPLHFSGILQLAQRIRTWIHDMPA